MVLTAQVWPIIFFLVWKWAALMLAFVVLGYLIRLRIGKVIFWASFLLLCVVPLLFLIAEKYNSPDRWRPISVLVPGAYNTINCPFKVREPGEYHFQISKWSTDETQNTDFPPTNRLLCDLEVNVRGFPSFSDTYSTTVVSLPRNRRIGAEGMEYYEGDAFSIPKQGDYVLFLRSRTYSAPLAFGALFEVKSDDIEEQSKTNAQSAAKAGKWAIRIGSAGLLISTGRAIRSRGETKVSTHGRLPSAGLAVTRT